LTFDKYPVYSVEMDKVPVDFATAERLTLGIDEMTVLATSAQTGDALFAVGVRMPPGGGPPVMHRHDPGELYYVIEGEFAFYTGGFGTPVQRITAGPGQVVPLAGGTPHTVRHETEEDAVALVVHAPGPPMENFSRAVAAASVDGIPDMNEVLAIAQRHGIELLGPIPALQH
jgi:mannose-6-phosphate isomerase-like protein (cupin superfamily)